MFKKFIIFIFKLLYPYKVYGKENITANGTVIVCNHYMALDPVYLISIFGYDLKVLAKKELFKNKLYSWFLNKMGAIPIDRDAPEIKSLLQCVKVLKNKNNLAIFPEGTRNKKGSFEMLPIKGGSALFSIKAKCAITPVMFYKKSRIFKKSFLIIGKPFELTEFYDKKISNEDIEEMDKIVYEKMSELHLSIKDIIEKRKKK